jgi:hypothetical protein
VAGRLRTDEWELMVAEHRDDAQLDPLQVKGISERFSSLFENSQVSPAKQTRASDALSNGQVDNRLHALLPGRLPD